MNQPLFVVGIWKIEYLVSSKKETFFCASGTFYWSILAQLSHEKHLIQCGEEVPFCNFLATNDGVM